MCYFANFNFLIWIAVQNMVSPLEIKNMKEFYSKKMSNPPVHAPWKFWKKVSEFGRLVYLMRVADDTNIVWNECEH